jgi:hypothetical protein
MVDSVQLLQGCRFYFESAWRELYVWFSHCVLQSGRTGNLKSFVRRRRTKVLDERTRDQQALAYGKCDFRPMRRTVRPSLWGVLRIVSLRHWRGARQFVVLQ